MFNLNLVFGVVLGLTAATIWPDIPYELRDWVNEAARAIVDATDPTLTERAEDALTDWRAQ